MVWLYVLSGTLRLILGGRDITLNAGEVAEFDTRIPHWFGPADDQPAEILSLLERTRRPHARPRRRNDQGQERLKRAGPELTSSPEQLQPRDQPRQLARRPATAHVPVKLAVYQFVKHECMNRTERYARNTRQI